MKEILCSQLNAFMPASNKRILFFFFRRLLIAFIPFSIAIFVASRSSSAFFRWIVLAAAFMWLYAIIMVSAGFIARFVYMGCVKKEEVDISSAASFSWEYGPAYMFIPVSVVIAGLALQIGIFLIIYSTLIPYFGEIVLGIILAPISIINLIFIVFSIFIVFLTPAIIGTEDRGITFVFNRTLTLFTHFKVKIFIYGIVILILLAILNLVFIVPGIISISMMTSLTKFIIDEKADSLLMVFMGHFNPSFARFNGDVPFTFNIFALLVYISLGFFMAVILTVPGIISFSSPVYFYEVLTKQAIEDLKIDDEEVCRE